jgi:hypothetical protein
MRVWFEADLEDLPLRQHPWTTSSLNPEWKYYDLKEQPQLIRSHLEDFKPYEHYESVQRVYELLEFLNGPDSFLETNDSRLSVNEPNPDFPRIPKKNLLMNDFSVLFRRVELNLLTNDEYTRALVRDIESKLDMTKEPVYGAIKLYRFGTGFIHVKDDFKEGNSVIYKLLAWGDTEEEQFKNHNRILDHLIPYFKSLKPPTTLP